MFGQILVTLEDFSHSLQTVSAESSLISPSLHQCSQLQPVEIELVVKRKCKAPEIQESQQVFPVTHNTQRKPASLFIYKTDETLRIVYLDFAVYDICGNQITCYPATQTSDKQLHLNFLGPVMSMWLEQNGFLVLHASAILINKKVSVFLADSQQGKSTIASHLIKMGYPLLSDDLLAIKYNQVEDQYVAYPSYPVIKLWPDQFSCVFEGEDPTEYLDKDLKKCRVRVDDLNKALFCNSDYPLAVIYCLHRQKSSSKLLIQPVSKIEAITRLIQYSFAAPIMIATGWQPVRMKIFSDMVSDIPVRDLTYPSDIHKLSLVCKATLNDVASAN